jgi:hypothetical protein
MIATKAVAQWGGGSLLIVSVGASTALLVNTASAVPKPTKPPTTSPGNGQGGGNNGNGVGNGTSGASPASKSLQIARASKTPTGQDVPVLDGALTPGASGTLTLNVTNPENQRVKLTLLKGETTGVTTKTPSVAPDACSPGWFVFDPYTVPAGTYLLPGETKQLSLTVRMDNKPVNQDNCQGQTYSFTFTATADQA